MYYHVIIETELSERKDKSIDRSIVELDQLELKQIIEQIVFPYLRKDNFQFDGYFLKPEDIKKLKIVTTNESTVTLAQYENDNRTEHQKVIVVPKHIVIYTKYNKYTTDITRSVFDTAKLAFSETNGESTMMLHRIDYSKIFIVHGRDDLAKTEVARFVEKLGLNVIILHEQASTGNTVIEKIEEHTNVGFAIVLYTPCDEGNLVGETPKARARQNVIFEHGYLIGKLGRDKVCALVKGDVEKPNDISGVVYIMLDEHEGWHKKLVKELREAGYEIDANKII